MAPELLRCCWYVMLGAGLLMLATYWVGSVAGKPLNEMAVVMAVLGLLGASMAIPLRWTLRIDGTGVSRRLCLRWDRWSWDDLASGRVQKLLPRTLLDPQRPWWCRKLRLDCLASTDFHAVMYVINRIYVLPAAPEIPEQLTIRYAWRRSATMDGNRIQLIGGDMPRSYRWDDVQQILVTRIDAKRRDFISLVISFPNEEIELKTHKNSPTWRGATPAEVNEFLHRYVSPDRIDTAILDELPTKQQHIERRLQVARKFVREMSYAMVVYFVGMLGALIWMAVVDGVWKAVAMAVVLAVYPGSVFLFMRLSKRKELAKLQEMLAAVDDRPEESITSWTR